MTIQRMDHLGIVVEGTWVSRVIGLEGVRSDVAYLQAPDGHGAIELSKFHSPPSQEGSAAAPANASGFRHVSFIVDDIDAAVARLQSRGSELVGDVVQYEEIYRLCYVRGPEGIIVELAEQLGS